MAPSGRSHSEPLWNDPLRREADIRSSGAPQSLIDAFGTRLFAANTLAKKGILEGRVIVHVEPARRGRRSTLFHARLHVPVLSLKIWIGAEMPLTLSCPISSKRLRSVSASAMTQEMTQAALWALAASSMRAAMFMVSP